VSIVLQAAVAPPASADEALAMLKSAMGYLAAADPTEMPAEVQGRCLIVMEQVDAIETAARASILAAFTAAQGYAGDGQHSTRSWLIHRTQITAGTAVGHTEWPRRGKAHPRVMAALADGDISISFALMICKWTDQLPEECRDGADRILAAAARSRLGRRDLTALFAEMLEKAPPAASDQAGGNPDEVLEDRSVRLDTTYKGAGVLRGDLTPTCAAVVATVLDALSAPAGAEDTRSHAQRYHDALQEAMRRLVAAGMLPERAGQPAKVWAHVSLADLILLDADSAILNEWIAGVRDRWATVRAAGSARGGDGAAWLNGAEAEGFACDASVTPVVTCDVNLDVLDDLVRLCVKLAGHGRCEAVPGSGDETSTDLDEDVTGVGGSESEADHVGVGGSEGEAAGVGRSEDGADPLPPAGHGREALEQAIIGKAVELLSGRGGLASFLRRRQLGARLAGPSIPLDVGYSKDIPAGIRNAVRLRDQHCRWPGGCNQPAAACQVHHIRHKAHGGKTSLKQCILLCSYHHQVAIHRQGWTLVLNPDGTTSAWNRDKTKVLHSHSHSPPPRAG
jgi:5-methylcytosine-specific restriction endonuclease McrA